MIKKVLLTTKFSEHIGGLNSHMLSLEKKLKEKDIQVEVLMNKNLTLFQKISGVLLNIALYIKNKNLLVLKLQEKNYKQLYDEKMNKNYDIYHFHEVYSLYYSQKRKKGKYILTVHGPASKEESIAFPQNKDYINEIIKIEKESFKLADRIIAVDSGQKDILVKEYDVNKEKIDVIFNSIDTEFFKPDLNIKKEKYFLIPRRLVPKNGVNIAIQAMKYINEEYKLLIAGDGPERQILENIVEKNSLKNRVIFLGGVNHEKLYQLIIKSSGLIIPSVPVNGVVEATSISALEGMACGKLVVASNIGGLAEMINSEKNGLLFSAGDFKELALKINNIVSDEKKLSKIEENARKSVLENYSPENWVNQIIEVYKK